MIASSGRQVCVTFTEGNQNRTARLLPVLQDSLDLTVVDLYHNSFDKIQDDLSMDGTYAGSLSQARGTYFIGTKTSEDYIFLDHIL